MHIKKTSESFQFNITIQDMVDNSIDRGRVVLPARHMSAQYVARVATKELLENLGADMWGLHVYMYSVSHTSLKLFESELVDVIPSLGNPRFAHRLSLFRTGISAKGLSVKDNVLLTMLAE